MARAPAAHATRPPHLLAAMTGTGQTISQLRVPDKTNEITCLVALLEPYDLADVTVTADALHTQREHSRFLMEDKGPTTCSDQGQPARTVLKLR
ncbi:hypothetical protein L1I79_23925 [Strepomyces sp. STD 3.1]|uniref:hypothetical protein n=1 Tax=Streptomyces sp. NPDC058985 TaxID=3346684 RepID=UPI001F429BA4|nr:hypothetical protein [Streptomyces sp. STD 3.1]